MSCSNHRGVLVICNPQLDNHVRELFIKALEDKTLIIIDEAMNHVQVKHEALLKGKWVIDAVKEKDKKKRVQRNWRPQRQINHYS